jgi:hypothetical protein
LIFERVTETRPLEWPSADSPPGTRVALLAEEAGNSVAYGSISEVQPWVLGTVHVKTPGQNHLIIDIDTLLDRSVLAILHLHPKQSLPSSKKTKCGAFTLGKLKASSVTPTFQVVSPLFSLEFD